VPFVQKNHYCEQKIFHYKFISLSHNTIRGAAGGAILTAELLKAKGFFA